jgi:hypothetical protein
MTTNTGAWPSPTDPCNPMNKYTVVCLCLCGCDQTEVHHVVHSTPAQAAVAVERAVREDRHPRNIRILAIFNDHLHDRYQGH